MLKTNSRYKPLYKKFIRLRKNIQNRKKVSLGKFNKIKWKNLNKFLNRQTFIRKKNFRSYDLNGYFIKRYGNTYKRKFLLNLLNKQSFSLFYGSLKNKYLKKLVLASDNKSKNIKESNTNCIINTLETRLDTVLYRSHFVKSFREARYLIKHGHISLNGIKVTDNKYLLLKGDLVSIFPGNITNIIKHNVLQSNIWPIPPKSLLINYKLLNVIYLGGVKTNSFSNKFPFYINYNNVTSYYKKN